MGKYWLAENGEVRCLDDHCPQECDMSCPIYLQTIAVPYLQNGHFEEAAKYLTCAVKIEPTFAEAWNNLAACYGQMGRHQEAYQAYQKSFDLLEKPKPLFGMAVAAKNMGKNAMAMQIYADVLNMPVRAVDAKQGAALGSAMFAATAAGKESGGYDSIQDASAAMAPKNAHIYKPIADNVRIYEEIYREYAILHDYFGRGINNVMKRLKKIRLE